MKTGKWLLVFALAGVAMLIAMPASAQDDASIVQAARQKAADKKAKHVFTNEDFPERPEPQAAPQSDSSTAAVAGDSADAAKPDGAAPEKTDAKTADNKADSKTSASDAKLKDLETKLAEAKRGEQELQRKLDTLQEKADNEKDDFRRNMYLDMISNQQITLSQFRQEQENLKAQIAVAKSDTADNSKTKESDKAPQ